MRDGRGPRGDGGRGPQRDRPPRRDLHDSPRPDAPARAEPSADRPGPPAEALSPEARQQRDELRQRANLLRDFERSPFSLASFCALKGLKPEELAPVLDQARREAAASLHSAAKAVGATGDAAQGPARGAANGPRRGR
jgi:ProP effector